MSEYREAASDGRLVDALGALNDALEEFTAFEGPDLAVPRSAWIGDVDEPLPREGAGRDEVLALIADVVIRRGLRNGHPGFSGWVTTTPTDVGVAADLAQTVAASQRWWNHPGNHLDSMAVEWMIQLLGFPSDRVGIFTSGGSTANLLGLGAARQHAGERIGIDASLDGIAAIPRPRVYVNENTHHVVGRALGVLGLGRANIVPVPMDAGRRTDVGALAAAIDEDVAGGSTPIAVVGNGGDVNLGIVDHLGPMAEVAHERDVWFHVDGAYGGFGLLDEGVRERFGDPAGYDSFAVDPHKWMAAPVGTGLLICRDGNLLARSFTIETGSYDTERDAGAPVDEDATSIWTSTGRGTPDWGVDFSTPARGVAVWAILKEIGAEGMADRIRRHNRAARLVADRARSDPRLELLAEPELSICCFRYVAAGADLDLLNQSILDELRRRGTSVPSATVVDGAYALRPCFIGARSGPKEAAALVDEVLEIGDRLSGA